MVSNALRLRPKKKNALPPGVFVLAMLLSVSFAGNPPIDPSPEHNGEVAEFPRVTHGSFLRLYVCLHIVCYNIYVFIFLYGNTHILHTHTRDG
jgi:hypothetical protein